MLYRVDTTPPAPAESYGPHLTPFLRVKEHSRSTREENPRGDRCPRGSQRFAPLPGARRVLHQAAAPPHLVHDLFQRACRAVLSALTPGVACVLRSLPQRAPAFSPHIVRAGNTIASHRLRTCRQFPPQQDHADLGKIFTKDLRGMLCASRKVYHNPRMQLGGGVSPRREITNNSIENRKGEQT